MSTRKSHFALDAVGRSRLGAEQVIARLLPRLFPDPSGPVLIAIGGPGGTGKSTFAETLHRLLPESAVLTLDDYKTPRAERADRGIFGAHPDANHVGLIRTHLAAIRAGRPVDRPVYCMEAGAATTTTPHAPARYNIVDGEISTYPQFRDLFDVTIFIDSDWKTQLQTRITRDITIRGSSREKALATFLQSNLREFAEYGAEGKEHADIHVYCRDSYHLEIEAVRTDWSEAVSELVGGVHALDLSGLVVPVLTPFREDGEVDESAFVSHLEWLAGAGVSRVVTGGTTGEFFSLTVVERRRLFLAARRFFPGMVLCHVSRESLHATREEMDWSIDHGAEGILILPPYYYADVSEAGLVAWFTELTAEAPVPVILYNFPRHAKHALTPKVLSQVPHFAVKDSSGTLDLLSHAAVYFVGQDRLAGEGLSRGAQGLISGSANAVPELLLDLLAARAGGDADAWAASTSAIAALLDAVGDLDPIPAIKALVSIRNPAVSSRVRLPLTSVPRDRAERLRDTYEQVRGSP